MRLAQPNASVIPEPLILVLAISSARFHSAAAATPVRFTSSYLPASTGAHGGPFPADCGAGVSRKGPDGRGLANKEEEVKMSRIITASELQNRSLADLQALYRAVQQELSASATGSADRRNALASLENIGRAIAQAQSYPAPRF